MKQFIIVAMLTLSFFHDTVKAQFTINATGPTDDCFGPVTLAVLNPQPGFFYNWYVDSYVCAGGAGIPQGPYATGNVMQAFGSGVFVCHGDGPGGISQVSNTIPVRILPGSIGSFLLPLPYSSSTVICTTSVSLCIPTAFYQNFPNTTINWYKDNVLINGANSPSYLASVGGFYKYSVTSPCITAFSDSVEFITASSIPQFTHDGISPVCNGNTINFTAINPVPGAVYTWQTSNFPTSGFVAASSGVNFAFTVPSALNVYVRLQRVISGCSVQITPAVGFTIQNISRQITPFNTQTLCPGSSIAFSIFASGGTLTLQWMKNGVAIPGATGTNYSATSAGVYNVRVTSACGDSYSNSVTVVSGSAPTAVISPQGSLTFCAGGNVTLNANTGAGLTYQWKKYGNIIAGATSASYVASSAGTYKVVVTNSGGCSSSSANVIVTVNALPTATITAAGATTFCPGGSVQLQANTGTGLTYQWKKNSNIIAGATSSTYTASTAGPYKVTVTNANTCTKNSNSITVTTLAAPTATITANGPTSFCAGDSVQLTLSGNGISFQWKKGANPIPGAIGSFYYAKTAGNYKCTVTNAAGCTKNSNVIAVTVPCRIGELISTSEDEISVYPNPSNDDFYLHGTYSGEIIITDLTGKMVQFETQFIDEQTITISGLSTGIYFLRIASENESRVFKLVKM